MQFTASPGRRRGFLAAITAAAAAAVASGLTLVTPAASAAVAQDPPAPASSPSAASPWALRAADPDHSNEKTLCPAPSHAGQAACFAVRLTNLQALARSAARSAAPLGYGPGDLQKAYHLNPALGAGRTVAIVDAYDDPDAASDLATYRNTYGLPPCAAASGCFRKVSQTGSTRYPPARAGWAGEISLDLDMASAICPRCKLLLVEASNASMDSLGAAVDEAVALGAKYVTNSYGDDESAADPGYDSRYYNHPGVVITAATGDGGYGTSYPSASPYVVAAGGTTLTRSNSARGWTESAWADTGSGCSAYASKPAWQQDTGCPRRMVADVAAVADPTTGVAVYDSYEAGGWQVYGGTSVSSPIIAAAYALAGLPAAGTYPASYLYAHPSSLNDITAGANGSCGVAYLCQAQTGYDGPTGLGTPSGTAAFTAPARQPSCPCAASTRARPAAHTWRRQATRQIASR